MYMEAMSVPLVFPWRFVF